MSSQMWLEMYAGENFIPVIRPEFNNDDSLL